jgi:hypothetical protein
MPQAEQAPNLNIPASQNTVEVWIIDTTAHVSVGTAAFMEPHIAGHDKLNAVCYAFLIKHNNPNAKSKYDTMLFDLGVRTDVENSPKVIAERIRTQVKVSVEKGVVDILREQGENPDEVGAIIWSHYHWVSRNQLLVN